jgi:hypothetical protein
MILSRLIARERAVRAAPPYEVEVIIWVAWKPPVDAKGAAL